MLPGARDGAQPQHKRTARRADQSTQRRPVAPLDHFSPACEATMKPVPSVSQRDLDPLLLQPVRLFIACLLADTRWHEQREIQGALGLPTPDLELHVRFLRASGYVHSRGDERPWTELRLTTLGLNRLMDHIVALKAVATTAAELVAGRRDRSAHHSRTGSTDAPSGPSETPP
ncbi:transcriptional regulator [Amycolatopsis sp. NPDC051758]|uniref:transcriptional regulator n=1 Tax=Amycolatopsis sp. NPDC051758 TaxID=3363935 RepID=UPI0037A85C27